MIQYILHSLKTVYTVNLKKAVDFFFSLPILYHFSKILNSYNSNNEYIFSKFKKKIEKKREGIANKQKEKNKNLKILNKEDFTKYFFKYATVQ